ncbi:hypothetical protein [Dickeya fangzhongdai]|uniref:hypothetical protein n=1 Tax=Dickeya fangzhongdai TaxID=1778540 RepID=UPI000ABE51C0|nr:hypothetical protein [Dickeya fangzhongdai]
MKNSKVAFIMLFLNGAEGRVTSISGVKADAFSYQVALSAMTDRQFVMTIGSIH